MKRYNFEDLVASVNERLGRITVDKDKFTLKKKYNENDEGGGIRIYHEATDVVTFHFMITHRVVNGHVSISAGIVLYALSYPRWYHEYLQDGLNKDVFVDEYFEAYINTRDRHHLIYFLDKFLPVEKKDDINKIQEIAKKNSIELSTVLCDTFRKAYILKVDINKFLGANTVNASTNDAKELNLCKYVSLETYRCMLNNRTFRMNSMIAMNDIYEGIWLHNLIYNDNLTNKKDYYKQVVRQRNTLIASFTDKRDDADMWRFYGDNGKGVCLCFKVNRDDVTKVVYTRKDDKNIANLRKAISEMSKNGYGIIIEDVNNAKYVVKSSSFKSEGEYRYIYQACDNETELANYGGILSPYKDFLFDSSTGKYENLPFHLEGVYLGHNIPYYSTNMPLLIEKTHGMFPKAYIYESQIKELR